ncbi:hypothetical protein BgiMline_009406, partial [Biomphalaria glabrata]
YPNHPLYSKLADMRSKGAGCGLYHPSYRLLSMDNCLHPGLYEPTCAFGVVCEQWEYIRDNL